MRQALVAEVLREHRQRGHVIDRDVEEALHLARVQVHREDAIDAGGLEEVGDEARADRLARRRLLVGARVRIPGHDGRDPLGRRELRRVHHQQQLHQVPVDRRRARLHEEHVGTADRLAEAHVQLAVRERLQLDVAERQPEVARDHVRQIGVRPPREHHHPADRLAIVVARHGAPPPAGGSPLRARARLRAGSSCPWVRSSSRSLLAARRDALGVALLDSLARTRDGERTVRDIVGDHRSRCDRRSRHRREPARRGRSCCSCGRRPRSRCGASRARRSSR